jgi:hypothetical protein
MPKYGIIKNHQIRPSPTGHPSKETSPKGNVFFVRGREQEDIAERQCLFLLAALKLK